MLFGNIGNVELLFITVILFIFVVPFWRIFSKAGYPGWLGIGILFPFINFLLVLFLAFAKWPVEKRLQILDDEGKFRKA